MRAWQLVRQAWENMGRSRLRTALTMLGVVIASGSIVCMVGFVLGLQQQVETPFRQLGLLHNIEVRPGSQEDASKQEDAKKEEADADDSTQKPILDDAMLKQLEAIDGVDYACPDLRLSEIEVKHGDTTQRVQAIGVPREVSLISVFGDLIQAGNFFSLDDKPEAIITEKLADRLKFDSAEQAVGQMIEIQAGGLTSDDANEFSYQKERIEAKIVGVFQVPGMPGAFGDHALLLPVDMMRNLPGILAETRLQQLRSNQTGVAGTYPRVTVRVEHPDQVAHVEQSIQQLGLKTRAMVTQIEEMRTFFIFLKLLLTSVGTVALVVAGLGILNTQLMTVIERKSEIGLYKAIGASDGDVRLLFLTEAAVVGLCGGLGGLLLARAVAAIIQWGVGLYLSSLEIDAPLVFFRFPLWLLAGAVGYSVIASILSGLYPASRAARLDPIQALRGP